MSNTYADLVMAFEKATAAKDTSDAAFDHWLDVGRALATARRVRQDAKQQTIYHHTTSASDPYPAAQFERGIDEELLS